MSVRAEERKSVKGGVGGRREWSSTRCGVRPPLHQTAGAQVSVSCTKLPSALISCQRQKQIDQLLTAKKGIRRGKYM